MNELLERVLSKLGFTRPPDNTLQGLAALYSAWCGKVPFDNVRKLIHVRAGNPGPLPGSTAEDFFDAWLRHGTGGTCWAANGAFQTFLQWFGFAAERGIATMLAAPNLPPNHGTVRVRFGAEYYLVDCSILHGDPLLLDSNRMSRVEHPAWGVTCTPVVNRWLIAWRPLHKVNGFECRLEGFGAAVEEFRSLYDQTRAWSPFNFQVTARLNHATEVSGVAFGKAVTLHADGGVSETLIDDKERRRRLIEEIGLSEEIVSQLPPDTETPPPPGSRTAQRQNAEGADL